MVLFNHATREMTAKIVYYGPGLCGKTTNLLVIYDKLDPQQKGKMLSLATKTDRTLFFDLLPVDIGKVGAFNLKIQLYTVPGQVFYNETRKLVLKGADAVVFVADSQGSMVESTKESFANLLENLQENQIDANELPIVIQYNKRDIPGVLPVDELQDRLGLEGYPYTEAAAINGEGVMETFKLVSKITAKHLINKLKPGARTESPEREAPSRGEKKKKKAVTVREPEPAPEVAEAEVNPFADSMPFAEEAPIAQDYEKVEEVSLEKLLEGRDRPATISGNVPIPVQFDEEVDHLDATEMIEDEGSVSVAVEEEPAPYAPTKMSRAFGDEPKAQEGGADLEFLRQEIVAMRAEITELRDQHSRLLDAIGKGLTDLGRKIERSS